MKLTKLERNILKYIFLTNADIAAKIGLSTASIDKGITSLLKKFTATNRTELALKASKAGHQIDESVYEERAPRFLGKRSLRVIAGGQAGVSQKKC